jgi:hypothetical protein
MLSNSLVGNGEINYLVPLSGYWSQTELSYAGTATPTPSRTPTVTPTIEGCTNPYSLNELINYVRSISEGKPGAYSCP